MEFTYRTVYHVVDSAIVRAQIQKESYGFSSFVATKIAEIQNKSDPKEWWWIATRDSPADLVTIPTSPTRRIYVHVATRAEALAATSGPVADQPSNTRSGATGPYRSTHNAR